MNLRNILPKNKGYLDSKHLLGIDKHKIKLNINWTFIVFSFYKTLDNDVLWMVTHVEFQVLLIIISTLNVNMDNISFF